MEGSDRHWLRRAQPLLGTLVEVGVAHAAGGPAAAAAAQAALDAVAQAQACLSRYEADSDLSRFHALPLGGRLRLRPCTLAVLQAAQELQQSSAGCFDISLGSAPDGWQLDGDTLVKRSPHTRLDLGGIGKGHAVDMAVQALKASGCDKGWINAGGDLRAFGDVDLPIQLRDEACGGVRPFARLRDGAFATSAYGRGRRSQLHGARNFEPLQASVAAPRCLWADALTKIVAGTGNAQHPLLARYAASAWLHTPAWADPANRKSA